VGTCVEKSAFLKRKSRTFNMDMLNIPAALTTFNML